MTSILFHCNNCFRDPLPSINRKLDIGQQQQQKRFTTDEDLKNHNLSTCLLTNSFPHTIKQSTPREKE